MAESLPAGDGDSGRNNPAVKLLLQQQATSEMLSVLWAACGPHQRALLGMLAISDRYGIDLNDLLNILGPELPRSYQPLVYKLAEEVSGGATPLSVLQQIPELLPISATLALQLSKENGRLPDLYDSILTRRCDPAAELAGRRRQILGSMTRFYCTVLAIVAVSVVIFIKVLPQFFEMLSEFELEPPLALELLSHSGEVPTFVVLAVFLLSIALLPILLPALIDFLRSWNPHRWQSTRWVASAERRRWLAWESSGGFAAAAASFLTRSERRSLSATASRETRTWLLNWFATHLQHRHVSRSNFWVRLSVGMVYVILGLFVLLVAVAVFSTLIGIINGLSEW